MVKNRKYRRSNTCNFTHIVSWSTHLTHSFDHFHDTTYPFYYREWHREDECECERDEYECNSLCQSMRAWERENTYRSVSISIIIKTIPSKLTDFMLTFAPFLINTFRSITSVCPFRAALKRGVCLVFVCSLLRRPKKSRKGSSPNDCHQNIGFQHWYNLLLHSFDITASRALPSSWITAAFSIKRKHKPCWRVIFFSLDVWRCVWICVDVWMCADLCGCVGRVWMCVLDVCGCVCVGCVLCYVFILGCSCA